MNLNSFYLLGFVSLSPTYFECAMSNLIFVSTRLMVALPGSVCSICTGR